MAFQRKDSAIPSFIGNISVSLEEIFMGEVSNKNVIFRFQVLDQSRKLISTEIGNLKDYITVPQANQLKNFMQNLRVQIESEVLPSVPI
jgi:hypothetical protein